MSAQHFFAQPLIVALIMTDASHEILNQNNAIASMTPSSGSSSTRNQAKNAEPRYTPGRLPIAMFTIWGLATVYIHSRSWLEGSNATLLFLRLKMRRQHGAKCFGTEHFFSQCKATSRA